MGKYNGSKIGLKAKYTSILLFQQISPSLLTTVAHQENIIIGSDLSTWNI